MNDYIHINGQLLPYDHASIAPGDAGFLHGAGLFETLRSRNGKIFRPRQHLERLSTSADILAISLSLDESQLTDLATELLEANDLMYGDARLRLTISRGDTHAISDENPTPPITLVLTAQRLNPYPTTLYHTGMTVINSRFKQNLDSPITGHKCTSYFERLAALREAHAARAGEALWFTAHSNYLAEGSISNVFIVDQDGHLATPPLTLPIENSPLAPHYAPHTAPRLCLPGIARQVILECATQINILPHERLLTIHDLLSAREVFLTNILMGAMPVTQIEQHPVASGKPGSLTTELHQAFLALQ